MADQPPGAPASLPPGDIAAAPSVPAVHAPGLVMTPEAEPAAADAPGMPAASYQSLFEARWPHLTNPHVRALAWLLEAPDLLDPVSPHWQGRIATLGAISPATQAWLNALEHDPSPLEAALGSKHYSRLGLYAEKLMAFYFAEQGELYAHGLQVRADRTDTIGEFDFLLHEGDQLVHIEFATKFYLLDGADNLNGLIGPNLADTLGLKMRKIFDKQLSLSQHPVAQAMLPQPVARAQALVKGWLFYPDGVQPMPGISQQHCHGFWMTQTQAAKALPPQHYAVLPRLHWLAPLKTAAANGVDREALLAAITGQEVPVMIVALQEKGEWLIEECRGFIVPDGWRAQAAQRRHDGVLPA